MSMLYLEWNPRVGGMRREIKQRRVNKYKVGVLASWPPLHKEIEFISWDIPERHYESIML